MIKKFLLFLTSVCLLASFIGAVGAQQTTCSSCSECSQKLNGSYSTVILSNSISSSSGDCITFSSGSVTLDCNSYNSNGSQQGLGIYNNGYNDVEIKNCDISYFDTGIYVRGAQQNSITGNTVAYNEDYGIIIELVDNSHLTNNTALYNGTGILSKKQKKLPSARRAEESLLFLYCMFFAPLA